MASCNRAVIDGVTAVNHAVWGNSNPQAIQWQFRDALGAGCDMPRMYSGGNPQQPYYGPLWFDGQLYSKNPGWSPGFWKSPKMFDSYVINSQIIQTSDSRSRNSRRYALMTDGTYPSVRDSNFSIRRQAPDIPENWQERQRIYVSGNCLNNGVKQEQMFRNHSPRGMSAGGKHRYDTTNKFTAKGSNLCEQRQGPDNDLLQAMQRYIESLPQPQWLEWGL